MSQKSSTFISETRERETWIGTPAERDGGEVSPAQLLATAALVRGVVDAIEVPADAEERSRAQAVAYMRELRSERRQQRETRAPWYLRFGHAMRYVFTLGRRR